MTIAHMSANKLVRTLKDQGLTVVEDGPKIVVTNNNGGLHSFHRSSLEKSGHVYAEIMKDLMALGFQDPVVWEKKRRVQKQLERAEYKYVCEGEAATRFGVTCGCGQRFKHPMHLARHLQALANRQGVVVTGDGAVLPKPEKPEATKAWPVETTRQVRKIVKHLQTMNAEIVTLLEIIEPMLVENEDLKRKLRKVEDLFGRVLDEL